MWLVVVLAASFSTAHWLLALAADGWVAQLVLFAVYMSAIEWLHRSDRLFVRAARAGWLARLVQRYAPVRFSRKSLEQLRKLAPLKRQLMFCLAPHGPLCLGMAIGFAGHCGQIPQAISDRLRIIGHWSIRLIPFVRELAAVFGIVSSLRAPVDETLAAGHHVALIPCGMSSKVQALVDAPTDSSVVVVHRQRTKLGFLALAVRHKLLVVPVLAPDENHLYARIGASCGLWWLTLLVGRYLLLPRCALELRVGAPLDPARYDGDVARLEAAYYAALTALAAPTHQIEFRYID
jgi:hypothetical protein